MGTSKIPRSRPEKDWDHFRVLGGCRQNSLLIPESIFDADWLRPENRKLKSLLKCLEPLLKIKALRVWERRARLSLTVCLSLTCEDISVFAWLSISNLSGSIYVSLSRSIYVSIYFSLFLCCSFYDSMSVPFFFSLSLYFASLQSMRRFSQETSNWPRRPVWSSYKQQTRNNIGMY